MYRPGVCAQGECIPAVSVPGVSVPGVSIPGESIEGRKLPEIKSSCVRVFEGKGTTDYNVCSDVLFAFNQPKAAGVLRPGAKSLRQRSGDSPIRIEGHTDSKGDPAFNVRLGQRRAEAVKRWLVSNGGIDAARIRTQSLGEAKPAASNSSAAGRQRNRRVVIGVDKG